MRLIATCRVATISIVLAATLAAGASAKTGANRQPTFDLILRGGTIYSGEAPAFVGDVAIRGDRIVYVGPRAKGHAKRLIDARGLIVAPGFIDPHTHAGDALASPDPAARLVLPFLTQGVTTAFIGVDGGGSADVAGALGLAKAGTPRDQGVNFATYVGFGSVRSAVVGNADRAPGAVELEQMKSLVSQAMCQGALGLSTGLFYAPQSFAKRDEVVALARVAAQHGGLYDSHIRDEASYSIGLLGAVDETLAIGREADIPVHFAHIKALGTDVQGFAPQVIARIAAAQTAGQVVTADQYPWSASGTRLSAALIPRWAQDGGRTAMLSRFQDSAAMTKMQPEIADNLRRRGGPGAILITSGPRSIAGKTLETFAREQGTDPVAAAITVLEQDEVGIASFNQSEADIAAFMQQPWVVTSSDASMGHPRYYASFARKYATYVKERKVIDLRTFIAASTIRTARIFGLEGRGELKAGAFADVIAFDPARFVPRADYAHPTLFSRGMQLVVVNGELAIEDGQPTGIAAGRPLPRQPKAGTCTLP
jgi:N-acyl-D-amino-acid deacylase